MKNFYEELELSQSMSLEDIQDNLESQRRRWASRTNSADADKRKEAETRVDLIDEALDGAFADASSRKSYDSKLAKEADSAEQKSEEPAASEHSHKKQMSTAEQKRLAEKEQQVRAAEDQRRVEQAHYNRKRQRRRKMTRFLIFLLIVGGIGGYYYIKHIQPIQEIYNQAQVSMTNGSYQDACQDFFAVHDAWFSKLLFRDAYDKGYEACMLWLGQEPVITTEEESPWFSLDEEGGLEFDEDDVPQGTEFLLPTILDGNLVTGIASYGFEDCNSIYSVELPANYLWIGEKAFYGCDNLSAVTLSNVESIGDRAFCDCDNLTVFTDNGGLDSIGVEAFYECSYLTTVTLSEGLTVIGEKAFFCCPCLQSITIPGSVTFIGNYAFAETGLSSLQFAEGTASLVVGEGAFSSCENLTTVVIPSNVTELGIKAFQNCEYLTSVTIGDGCAMIGSSAFNGDKQLAYVALGQGLQTIGEFSFAGTGLYGDLYLPASLTSIGESAFENCESLTNIYASDDTANLVIQKGAFSSCDYLQGAYLPGVAQLGDSVFDNCVNMYWVYLGSNLSSIGSWCFSHASLSEIHLSDGLTVIGEGAFYDNDNLIGIDIPAGVGILEASTISECESLRWIVLREGLSIIRDGAICYNANLSEIYYTGDETAWSSIAIGSNDQLSDCVFYFNYTNG